MNILNKNIENISNPIELVKILTKDLDSYLEYYSILRLDNLNELIENINSKSFFIIRGATGSGKSSFLTVAKQIFDSHVNIFEYHCSEITELDDIFLKFYKFTLENPIKTDLVRGSKSVFKPNSIDEQILHYIKNSGENLVLIFDNFEKLLDAEGELKASNVRSFFEFLATTSNVKSIVLSSVNIKSSIDFDEDRLIETRLEALEEDQIKNFLNIFKVSVHQSLLPEIYDKTKGYIFSLKFLVLASKVLQLPVNEILKEVTNKNVPLNDFIARRLIGKLSQDAKKILYYIAFFRHDISKNILQNIDHFSKLQDDITVLLDYMLIDGDKQYEMREFLKTLLYDSLPKKEKAKLHEKIADFYAEQIPLKPHERVVEISRSSMYSEKFYHYNVFSKISKSFELNSARVEESQYSHDILPTADRIKYIASTKYLPDFEVKSKSDDDVTLKNQKHDDKAINIDIDATDITLSDEEKALLSDYSGVDTEEVSEKQKTFDTDDSSYSDTDDANSDDAENKYDVGIYYDNFDEIRENILDEDKKAANLLQKGLELYNEGDSQEAVTYLKNATSFYHDKYDQNYFISKLTLAKALSENFQLDEASKYLNELVVEESPNEILADVLFELGLIAEYNKNNSEALDCYTSAINIANDNNLPLIASKIYFQMALMFDENNETDNALQYYLLTAEAADNINDKTILASSYANIASIYEEKNDIESALLYYKLSLTEDEKNENYDGQAKTLSSLGDLYLNLGKINVAINLFIKQTKVAKKTDDSYLLASGYLELGDAFLKKKDYKNALKAYLLSKKNIDSTISTDSKNKIERRFDVIVSEIGESAYKFLLKELKTNGR